MDETSKNTAYRTVRSGGGRAIHLTTDGPREFNAATLCGRAAGCEVVTSALMTTCGHCARRAGVAKGEKIHAAPPAEPSEDAQRPQDEAVSEAAPKAPARDVPRAALYLRLSRSSDDSTSIAGQRRRTTAYAEANGWRVVAEYVDDGVSGAVPLREREGMSGLLDAMEAGEIAHAIALKPDRYERKGSVREDLVMTAELADVELWTVEGGRYGDDDTTAAHGFISEMERRRIAKRVRDSKDELRRAGRWGNGAPPYGYVIVLRDGGKYLAPCPDTAPLVRDMARRVIAGTRVETIVEDMTARGLLSPADRARVLFGRKPRGTAWSTTVVRELLTSWRMLGYQVWDPRPKREKITRTANGGTKRSKLKAKHLVPFYGDDGKPVTVTLDGSGLLDAETFDLVRTTIGARSHRPAEYVTNSLWKGIATCTGCGTAMYRNGRTDRGSANYRCMRKGCESPAAISENMLAEPVTSEFLATWGDVRMWRNVTEADDGGAERLADAERRLTAQADMVSRFQPGTPAYETLAAGLAAVSAEVGELRARASTPTVRRVFDDMTLGERWHAAADDGQRRALLRDLGTVAEVTRGKGPGRVQVWFRSELAGFLLVALSAMADPDLMGDEHSA